MPGELTKKLLQIVVENQALKNQVRRLQGQVKFLRKHCRCPEPPPPPLHAFAKDIDANEFSSKKESKTYN